MKYFLILMLLPAVTQHYKFIQHGNGAHFKLQVLVSFGRIHATCTKNRNLVKLLTKKII